MSDREGGEKSGNVADSGLTLPAPVDGEAALIVALKWLREPLWPKGHGSAALRVLGTPDATDNLVTRMRAAGLKDWSESIQASMCGVAEPLGANRSVQWLFAQTALELAQTADHPQLFELTGDLQSLSEDTAVALADALCVRLGAPSDDHPLPQTLEARMQSVYSSHFYDRLRQYAEKKPEEPLNTRDLWPGRAEWPMREHWIYRVIGTLWPVRYLQVLAGYPAPFQHAAANILAPLEIRVVVALIAASPPVFSEEGAPFGPTVIFGILEEFEEELIRKAVANAEAPKPDLDNVLDVLFARAEGAWIARAWLQQTIWRGARRRAGRSNIEMDAWGALSDALLYELSRRTFPRGVNLWDWVQAEEALWQVDRVLAEVSVVHAHGDPQGAAEILASAVAKGLVSATGRADGLVTSTTEAKIVGRVLAEIPDPAAWFEELWRATYEAREHLSFQVHRNLDNPACPALAWGLHGLNVSVGGGSDAVKFWRRLADALFETQLTDPNADLPNGAIPSICRVAIQLGAALTEGRVLGIADIGNFLANQLEPDIEHAVLWRIVRSAASDATAIEVGRFVGAPEVRQALQAALADDATRKWNTVFDQDGRADLLDFAARL
ncbi:hypothetical protein JMJ56_19575 [Belnapia sp. T18]|uniref:Uncharacterized protein n=1 Tax=Belnapia arida TaxID=2804533 RepID=A0ABS1U697_9PROT|nr:hypothetical protein [Belnapia arida]MBL6080222.1 hypothetical protein [Belnapia arida]